MTIENQEAQIRKRYEGERSREVKEVEVDPELRAAATMERADFLVKEVKQSKKQMQNIMLHMQQVMATIRSLLMQLQLPTDEHPASVEQDKKRVEQLQKKITLYRSELSKMKDDLILEYAKTMREQDPELSIKDAEQRAGEAVEKILFDIE